MGQQFAIAEDDEFLDALGITPEPVSDDETARVLRVSSGTDDVLTLTYDPPGRSIRCQWHRGDSLLLDVFREGATRLAVESKKSETYLLVEFEVEGLAGQLKIQVFPAVKIHDELLVV